MEPVFSGSQFIEQQLKLEKAARKKFPYDPSECSLYMDVPSRQLLFACLTCQPSNAICYACGIRCHAGHDIVELYSKRNIRCDCGTARLSHPCSLRRTPNDPLSNPRIEYQHNFQGYFCSCNEFVHDESYGQSAMFQCLIGTKCQEDWFHARCIVKINREAEIERQSQAENAQWNSEDSEQESGDELFSVYPEIPEDFGALICPQCAPDVEELCRSSAVLSKLNHFFFLKPNYGEIVKQELPEMISQFPFLDGEEPVYTPEVDADESTLLEAGEQALNNLPHGMVIDSIEQFNNLRRALVDYLQSIGATDRVITREDIQTFFRFYSTSLERA